MSPKSFLIFVCVAFLATSTVEAQIIIGNAIHVNGTLYCSSNGNPTGTATPVFPNARVEARCAPGVIADSPFNRATTNARGAYIVMMIPLRNATIASITSNCRLFVLTPLSACNPTLPSVGLVSNLIFVNTIRLGFTRITYLVAAGFTLQS